MFKKDGQVALLNLFDNDMQCDCIVICPCAEIHTSGNCLLCIIHLLRMYFFPLYAQFAPRQPQQ